MTLSNFSAMLPSDFEIESLDLRSSLTCEETRHLPLSWQDPLLSTAHLPCRLDPIARTSRHPRCYEWQQGGSVPSQANSE